MTTYVTYLFQHSDFEQERCVATHVQNREVHPPAWDFSRFSVVCHGSDIFSKWPEIRNSSSTKMQTVKAMRRSFSFQRIPPLVTENRPQLLAREFETFMKVNGIILAQ